MEKEKILPFVEPIYRFCYNRVENRWDAEDLAGEILVHILEGMERYEIHSLEAWIWRIAHNRYAQFLQAHKKASALVVPCPKLYGQHKKETQGRIY